MKWVRVTRQYKCPVCQKPDWCSVSDDGQVVVCMRVQSDKACKSGGWFHELSERPAPAPYVPKAKPAPQTVPSADFTDLACRYTEAVPSFVIVAQELGVSASSLERLQIGYTGTAYTFPMRDGTERVIGIRVRAPDGRKWCVPGSRNGLFWPDGVSAKDRDRLLICEGPTDCAALLDLGYAAIGRPSCVGGVDMIQTVLRQSSRDVVIMADHDEPHARPDGTVWFPGQEGAEKLAEEIRPLCRTLRVAKPPFVKDVRDWLKEGATRAVVDCVIKSARFWQ